MSLKKYLDQVEKIVKDYNGKLEDFADYKLNLEEELSDFLTENDYYNKKAEGELVFVSNLEKPSEIAKLFVNKELKTIIEEKIRFNILIGMVIAIFFIILGVFQFWEFLGTGIFEREEHIYYYFRLGSYYLFYIFWLIIYGKGIQKLFNYLSGDGKTRLKIIHPNQSNMFELGITSIIASILGIHIGILIYFLLNLKVDDFIQFTLNIIDLEYLLEFQTPFYIQFGLPVTILTIFILFSNKYTTQNENISKIDPQKYKNTKFLQFNKLMVIIVLTYLIVDKIVFYSIFNYYELLFNTLNIIFLIPLLFIIIYKFLPANLSIIREITSNTKNLILTIVILVLTTIFVSIGTEFLLYLLTNENVTFLYYFLQGLLIYNYFPIITIFLLYILLVNFKSNIRRIGQ
jgi:hypothetical protein